MRRRRDGTKGGGVVVMKDVDEYIIEFSRRRERAGLVRLHTRDKYDDNKVTAI